VNGPIEMLLPRQGQQIDHQQQPNATHDPVVSGYFLTLTSPSFDWSPNARSLVARSCYDSYGTSAYGAVLSYRSRRPRSSSDGCLGRGNAGYWHPER